MWPNKQSIEAQAGDSQGSLQSQIDSLKTLLAEQIANHVHNGSMAQRIRLETDLGGLFETVSAVPTNTPSIFFDQIKFYSSGGTYRLYVYDATGQAWHYTTLT